MLRMHLVALLALFLAGVAHGDEAKPKSEPKPQWQRMLTGADARKATDLEQRIKKLEAADKYAEAIRLHEELLALRTQVQGADHWQTVGAKWKLATTTKVAALPAEKRAGWRQAELGDEEAQRLEKKALYGKALSLKQERLKWCREILGEEHPDTASSYHNVAANLAAQGKNAKAGRLWKRQRTATRPSVSAWLEPAWHAPRSGRNFLPTPSWLPHKPVRGEPPMPGQPWKPTWLADCSTTWQSDAASA